MHQPFYVIDKESGETPLQTIARLRTKMSIGEEIPLAYAGRLDPMASGKLLILAGDECKRQERYHALDKEYFFEILFGFETDTGDILGIPTEYAEETPSEKMVHEVLEKVSKRLALPYPAFSSKTVRGKPLFLWTLEGRLGEIEIPTATTKLHTVSCTKIQTLTGREILESIQTRINTLPHVEEESKKLGANFRREKILTEWRELLEKEVHKSFVVAQCSAIVSSGTYIRSLAPHIAEKLGVHGLAFSIHRTTIGRYFPITKHCGLWGKKYR